MAPRKPAVVQGISDIIPAEAVYQAVKRERVAFPDESADALVAQLAEKHTAFRQLTVEQVRAADIVLEKEANARAERHAASAAGELLHTQSDPDVASSVGAGDDVGPYEKGTIAESCRVVGQGIEEARVRQTAYFWIEAHDIHGMCAEETRRSDPGPCGDARLPRENRHPSTLR